MLNNLNVGSRLLIMNIILAIFMVVIGMIGLRGMTAAVGELQTVYEDRTVPIMELSKIHRILNNSFAEILRALQHDPAGKLVQLHDHPVSEHLERIDANKKTIDEMWQKYMSKRISPEEKQLADEFARKRTEWLDTILMPAANAIKNGDYSPEVVSAFLKGNRKLGGATDEAITALIKYQDSAAKHEYDRAVADSGTVRIWSLSSNFGGVVFGLLLGWWIRRSITVPLGQMRTTIAEVEKSGDFTRRINISDHDDVGQTAKSFNELMGTLQATLRNILGSVDKVSDAARILASSSAQAASSSVQQSEAASSMAATVEEVTASINHVSANAREALEASRKSGELSSQGGTIIHNAVTEIMQIADTVRQTAGSIEALGQQSNQISSVVQVIKDVADQTNLLALNAAIEAARAGEQGRGFAVVADEVRKLAERTTKATEEITHMIAGMQSSSHQAVNSMGAAVTKVGGGAALAQQAGAAINQIKDGAGHVIDVVNEISAALVEQSSASNNISAQVERVAQMTENNSAAASETADAANRLEQLAGEMRTAVSKFRI